MSQSIFYNPFDAITVINYFTRMFINSQPNSLALIFGYILIYLLIIKQIIQLLCVFFNYFDLKYLHKCKKYIRILNVALHQSIDLIALVECNQKNEDPERFQ